MRTIVIASWLLLGLFAHACGSSGPSSDDAGRSPALDRPASSPATDGPASERNSADAVPNAQDGPVRDSSSDAFAGLGACPEPPPPSSGIVPCPQAGLCTGASGAVCCECHMVIACGLAWKCADRRDDPAGCPAQAPRVDDPCGAGDDGLQCDYCGADGRPLNLLCGDGRWISQEFGCAN